MSAPLRPDITQATHPLTFEVDALNERGEILATPIAGESPLTLYLDRREIVTLMTLGQAPEALAIGYLRNQRLVKSVEELASVQVDWETGSVAVTTRRKRKGELEREDARTRLNALREKMKKRTVTTGCGQGTVFGDLMEEIDTLRLRDDVSLSEGALYALLDSVRRHETIYKAAGAVHGCALYSNGHNAAIAANDCDAGNSSANAAVPEPLYFVEDVGRHNAVDAIAGKMWLDGVDGSDKIFYTTGRLTSEMVIKAAQMRIPFLVSRSGLTQMGWDIARRVGITMIGRAVNQRYLLFTGKARFVKTVTLPTMLA